MRHTPLILGILLACCFASAEDIVAIRCDIVGEVSKEDTAKGVLWAMFGRSGGETFVFGQNYQEKAFVVRMPETKVRFVPREGKPIGFICGKLLWRDIGGLYSFLDLKTFDPARDISFASFRLDRWSGVAEIVARFPEGGLTGIPSIMPLAEVDKPFVLRALSQQGPRIKKEDTSVIVDDNGNVLMRFSSQINKFLLSPDGYKLLVPFNGVSYVHNIITKQTVALPNGDVPQPADSTEWKWLPDSTTFIGSMSTRVGRDGGQYGKSELFVYDLVNKKLGKIVLPDVINGTVLTVFDISADGMILLKCEETSNELSLNHLFVLRPRWADISESSVTKAIGK